MRSTAARVSRALTRRAGSRGRSAASAATTSAPSPRSPHWPNWTRWSISGIWPTKAVACAHAPARPASTSLRNSRCCGRCRTRCSRPAGGSLLASTASGRSPSAATPTPSRCGSSAASCGCCCAPTTSPSMTAAPTWPCPPRTAQWSWRLPPGPGPLPRSPAPQARGLPGLDAAGTGPLSRPLHPGPRQVVGRCPRRARRGRRHPRTHRGAAAGEAHGTRTSRRTADGWTAAGASRIGPFSRKC